VLVGKVVTFIMNGTPVLPNHDVEVEGTRSKSLGKAFTETAKLEINVPSCERSLQNGIAPRSCSPPKS
jgi:hypothetical protein